MKKSLKTNSAIQPRNREAPKFARDGGVLHCIRCEYDLRGISPDAVCPECGLRLAISHSRYTLGVFDRDWIANLNEGAKWIAYTVGFAIFGLLFVGGVADRNRELANKAMVIVPLAASVSFAIGVWHFTKPSSLQLMKLPGRLARMAAKWILLFSAAVAVPIVSIVYLGELVSPAELRILLNTGLVVFAAGVFLFGLYCLALSSLIDVRNLPFAPRGTGRFSTIKRRGAYRLTVIHLVAFAIAAAIGTIMWLTPAHLTSRSMFLENLGIICIFSLVYAGSHLLAIPLVLSRRIKGLQKQAERVWQDYDLSMNATDLTAAPTQS